MYNNIYFTDIATVKRQTYVNQKSTYSELPWSYKGKLKINSAVEITNIPNKKLGTEWLFFTKIWADIRETDILVINWKEYNVKELWEKPWLIVQFTKIILEIK